MEMTTRIIENFKKELLNAKDSSTDHGEKLLIDSFIMELSDIENLDYADKYPLDNDFYKHSSFDQRNTYVRIFSSNKKMFYSDGKYTTNVHKAKVYNLHEALSLADNNKKDDRLRVIEFDFDADLAEDLPWD